MEKENKSKGLTKRRWISICALCSVTGSLIISDSLLATFYPKEAASKGASASAYGFAMGCYDLMAFIACPIIGKYIYILGAKRTLGIGMILAAMTSISLGFTDLIQTNMGFITASIFLRLLQGLGGTAAFISAFTISAIINKENVAMSYAALDSFEGLGYIIGPTLGGLLFAIGGYTFPFVVMGFIILVAGIFVFLALPPLEKIEKNEKQVKIKEALKVTSVQLDTVCVVATSMSLGFLEATLEPHMRNFGISPAIMGLLFAINGVTYAILALIVGKLCDKGIYPKKIICIGSLFIVFSYVCLGPLPYSGIQKSLGLSIVGLILHGIGSAALITPTAIDAIHSAVAAGFPDDISTYGVVNGLWESSMAAGAFMGPSIGGYLWDTVGFQHGSLVIIAIHATLFIIITIFIATERKPGLNCNKIQPI